MIYWIYTNDGRKVGEFEIAEWLFAISPTSQMDQPLIEHCYAAHCGVLGIDPSAHHYAPA